MTQRTFTYDAFTRQDVQEHAGDAYLLHALEQEHALLNFTKIMGGLGFTVEWASDTTLLFRPTASRARYPEIMAFGVPNFNEQPATGVARATYSGQHHRAYYFDVDGSRELECWGVEDTSEATSHRAVA